MLIKSSPVIKPVNKENPENGWFDSVVFEESNQIAALESCQKKYSPEVCFICTTNISVKFFFEAKKITESGKRENDSEKIPSNKHFNQTIKALNTFNAYETFRILK